MRVSRSIRWSQEQAATEFGINVRTLATKIKTGGITPGQDHKFSTAQICAAVFGSLEFERRRKLSADADLSEIERDQKLEQLISINVAFKAWESILMTVRGKLIGLPSKLYQRIANRKDSECKTVLETEVDEILNELSKSPYYDTTEVAADPDGEGGETVHTTPEADSNGVG